MTGEARDYWRRALENLRLAAKISAEAPDIAASRIYYAAFYAVSALFALRGESFSKHSAVKAAVHRDLVKSGEWPEELGRAYTRLLELRDRGDYGGAEHVSQEDAAEALEAARRILAAVHQTDREIFPLPSETP